MTRFLLKRGLGLLYLDAAALPWAKVEKLVVLLLLVVVAVIAAFLTDMYDFCVCVWQEWVYAVAVGGWGRGSDVVKHQLYRRLVQVLPLGT